MFWQEETDSVTTYQVPEDIVDINFKVSCKTLPLDHAQSLTDALYQALPWLESEARAAIHAIHVAESGNGWMRPDNPETDVLHLSRRTRMTLRVPQERIEDTQALTGATLDIAGNSLTVGDASIKKLSKLTTIFARYMAASQVEDEAAYLREVYELLSEQNIRPKKMMSGRIQRIQSHQGELATRMLMLADLDIEQSVQLQQQGLGEGRHLGCGIFIPHKGIDAVNKPQHSD